MNNIRPTLIVLALIVSGAAAEASADGSLDDARWTAQAEINTAQARMIGRLETALNAALLRITSLEADVEGLWAGAKTMPTENGARHARRSILSLASSEPTRIDNESVKSCRLNATCGVTALQYIRVKGDLHVDGTIYYGGMKLPIVTYKPTMTPTPAPTNSPGGTAATAGESCKALLAQNPSLVSGAYYVTGGGSFAAKRLWCDYDSDGMGWTLVFVNINGVASPTSTGEVSASNLATALPSSPGKLSDAQISALASVGDGVSEYKYQCGSSYKRFFQLSHAYANAVSLVTSSDKCGASPGALVFASGAASSTNVGLSSTPNGDGCGTCLDRCGVGGSLGFWNSWHDYWTTTTSNGCYTRGTGYTSGYMWVR